MFTSEIDFWFFVVRLESNVAYKVYVLVLRKWFNWDKVLGDGFRILLIKLIKLYV